MPLIAVAVRIKMATRELRRQVDKAMKSELKSKAQEVQREAKASIRGKGGAPSTAGQPFKSYTGRARASIKTKIGRSARTTYVGFTPVPQVQSRGVKGRRIKVIDTKTGRAKTVQYANILEHGAKHMEPRPVLEPAVERVASRGLWKSRL